MSIGYSSFPDDFGCSILCSRALTRRQDQTDLAAPCRLSPPPPLPPSHLPPPVRLSSPRCILSPLLVVMCFYNPFTISSTIRNKKKLTTTATTTATTIDDQMAETAATSRRVLAERRRGNLPGRSPRTNHVPRVRPPLPPTRPLLRPFSSVRRHLRRLCLCSERRQQRERYCCRCCSGSGKSKSTS